MDTPGYNSPQTRTTFVSVPIITVGGSITAKLRANGVVSGAAAIIGNRPEHATLVTMVSQSGSYAAIQFRQSASSVTGTGVGFGSQLAVVGGGTTTATIYPSLPYVEVVSISGGTSGVGEVRLQLDSRIEWEQMAFAKTDNGVPPSLWKATNVPAESTLTR